MQENDQSKNQLLEHFKGIIEIKKSLHNIGLLLNMEEDQQAIAEYNQMKANLLQALEHQQLLIKHQEWKFNQQPITENDVGKIAKVYLEDNHWYNSEIIDVDFQEQTANVEIIGKAAKVQAHSVFINVYKPMRKQMICQGSYCHGIYYKDGLFYPLTIEKVLDNNLCEVRFKKYNNKETIKINWLKQNKNTQMSTQGKKLSDNLNQFRVPESYKIKPNDSDQLKIQKKKKIKLLKHAFKQAMVQKESESKQQKWKLFSASGKSLLKRSGQALKGNCIRKQIKKPILTNKGEQRVEQQQKFI